MGSMLVPSQFRNPRFIGGNLGLRCEGMGKGLWRAVVIRVSLPELCHMDPEPGIPASRKEKDKFSVIRHPGVAQVLVPRY